MRASLACLTLALALSGSCFDASVDVDDDEIALACARTSDCPSPLVCNRFSARCVDADVLARTPPEVVGEITLAPTSGDYSAVFRVTFTLSGPVADDPAVLITVGTRDVAWVLDETETDRAAHRFSFTFAPDTSVPEGVYAVRGGFISTDGVPAAAVNLGDIAIAVADIDVDDVPAVIRDASVDPAVGDYATAFVVDFVLDGVVADDPVVVVETGDGPFACALDDAGTDRAAGRFRFAFAPTVVVPEGTWSVRARWASPGGRSADGIVGTLTLDGTGPVTSVSLAPRLIGRGGRARLVVTTDSPLAAPPAVEFVDVDPGFALVESTDQRFEYELAVTCFADGCLPRDGRYRVAAVRVTDAAGNARRVVVDADVVVDTSAPRAVSLTTNRARYSEVDGFRDIVVAFAVDEDVAADDISVALDDLALACVVAGRDVRCDGVIDVDAVSEGDRIVSVSVVDDAGNASVALRSVTVDYTTPSLLAGATSVSLDPPSRSGVSHPGERVDVSLTASEVLVAAPVLEAVPDDVLLDVPSTDARPMTNVAFLGGRLATYSLTLDSTAREGGYRVRGTFVDDVGHAALLDIGVTFRFAQVVESVCTQFGCTDSDGDGQLGTSALCPDGPDCNDLDARVFLAAPEIPGDGLDNGCSGNGDDPIDESVGVFVDAVNGRPDGAGTRADPVRSVGGADVVFVAFGGSAGIADARVVVGGLDPVTWQPTGEQSAVFIGGGRVQAVSHVGTQVSVTGAPRALVVSSTFATGTPAEALSNAVIVDSSVTTMTIRNSAVVNSTTSGATFVGACTLLGGTAEASIVGAGGFPSPTEPGALRATNTLLRDLPNNPVVRAADGSTVTVVGGELLSAFVNFNQSMVEVTDLKLINTLVRPTSGRLIFGRPTVGAELRGLVFVTPTGFPAQIAPSTPLDLAGVVAVRDGCACSHFALTADTRSIDDVHILPDSPLVGLGVDPRTYSDQSSVDVDGDCRVDPFDVGRDELPE